MPALPEIGLWTVDSKQFGPRGCFFYLLVQSVNWISIPQFLKLLWNFLGIFLQFFGIFFGKQALCVNAKFEIWLMVFLEISKDLPTPMVD